MGRGAKGEVGLAPAVAALFSDGRQESIMKKKAIVKDRFIKSLKNILDPCPLIGDKWFCSPDGGDPADFQFRGIRKLSKATGRKPGKLARELVDEIDLSDVGGEMEITEDMIINVRFPHKG